MSYFTHILYPNFFELVMVFESGAFVQIQENGRTAIYLFGDDSLIQSSWKHINGGHVLFTSSSKHFMSIGILYHVFIVQIQSWGRFEFVFEKGSEILSENSWKLYFDFLNPSFATDQWVSWISPAPSSPRDTRPLPARLSLDLSPPPSATSLLTLFLPP